MSRPPLVASLLPALAGPPAVARAQTNLIAAPGLVAKCAAGQGSWSGTQDAGRVAFERSTGGPHAGRFAGKAVCRPGGCLRALGLSLMLHGVAEGAASLALARADAVSLEFDRTVPLECAGSNMTSDAGLLAYPPRARRYRTA